MRKVRRTGSDDKTLSKLKTTESHQTEDTLFSKSCLFDEETNKKRDGPASNLEGAAVALPTKASAHLSASVPLAIVKGTIVVVQARTWPGIKKPGGVARVIKVHPTVIHGNSSIKYDVAYVLGGRRKHVDESFIDFHEAITRREHIIDRLGIAEPFTARPIL